MPKRKTDPTTEEIAPAETSPEDEAERSAAEPVGSAAEVPEASAAAAAPEAEAPAAEVPEPPAVAPEAEAPAAETTRSAVEAAAPAAEADVAAPAPEAEAARKSELKRRSKPRLELADLVVGSQTRGKVVGLAKFGAFVDIGAVTDGLVHISELSKKRVGTVEEVVKQGDTVDVWIKEVDPKTKRISLSMRERALHPMDKLKRGEVIEGTVTSITKYGVFVDIGSETEGLVHISEMSNSFVDNPREIVSVGETIEVRIKEVDRQRERISLSMSGLTSDADGGQLEVPQDTETERQPTVVELALRRAMNEMQDEEDEAAERGEAPAPPAAGDETGGLAETYARMLAEYRETRSQD